MSEFNGGLKFQVFNGGIARPAANAKILLYDGESLINTLFTNSDGESETLPLPAPAEIFSTEGGEKPYSVYNAQISFDGAESLFIEGIQIFPNVISIQKADLFEGQTELIVIDAPSLWANDAEKIPEDEVKPLPEDEGFVVLDRVVVPEYIIVHDGAPSSGGQNYYVPFKDYIKNAASAEIYSTWEPAAIRANVLAIISFTLNRVYTEWYRSRGFDFTITNSTAYDQSYQYGRTVFEDISRVTDELFTTYIKRYNADQPLFAQYSDGRRVVREGWLSQWGSQELAQRGFTTIEILRYYYGDNIYLEQAEAVSGVPVSYPGTELSLGSTGSAVATIQNQLDRIGKTYFSVGRPVPDGIFGSKTQQSVINFQGIFNLPQTGVVDLATWYQISQVYVALERLAEL